jgi:hypothetical protein
MPKRTFQLLLAACLVTGTLWAENDPFVGKWKLNPFFSPWAFPILDFGLRRKSPSHVPDGW